MIATDWSIGGFISCSPNKNENLNQNKNENLNLNPNIARGPIRTRYRLNVQSMLP